MDQINTPVLNSPIGPLLSLLSFIDSIQGFVVPFLLSVMRETRLILYIFN